MTLFYNVTYVFLSLSYFLKYLDTLYLKFIILKIWDKLNDNKLSNKIDLLTFYTTILESMTKLQQDKLYGISYRASITEDAKVKKETVIQRYSYYSTVYNLLPTITVAC